MRHGTRQLSGERARHGAWHPATRLVLRRRAAGFVSAVDIPAVMEVLDALQSGADQYESYRWHAPFTARCDARGVDPKTDTSILESAQKLLDGPASGLEQLVAEADR